MITVKNLIMMLQTLPEDATVSAYEGEDIGLNINISNDVGSTWITARPTETEDEQPEWDSVIGGFKHDMLP